LDKFKLLGCNMSLKVHFLASHPWLLPSEYRSRKWRARWKVPPGSERCITTLSGTLDCKYDGRLLLVNRTWRPFQRALKNFKNTQILREMEKGDRGNLTYISKDCNVSKEERGCHLGSRKWRRGHVM
jgi:hypothetical protein